MVNSSAEQMRAWQGPALLSFGFRPFFLFGAVWACIAMLLWIPALSGAVTLPTRFDPVSWHAHAFLFGYLSAVLAGFLLTAVPNWTGRLPLVGRPLAGMFLIWLAGRVAVLCSDLLPVGIAPAIDLAFPIALGAVVLREIVAGKNWRNLMVLGLLAVFTLANLLFHIESSRGGVAAHGVGFRLGLGAGVMMIAVIGGRIIPSFTRNWLVREGKDARPTPPMQVFDKWVLVASIAGLLLWVLMPESFATGLALLALGALHLVRLVRWQGHHTGGEALVWVLHAAYAFIPLGAVVMGLALLLPDVVPAQPAQHIWMAGAIGLMTLAVMSRATLGHTGQTLHARGGTLVIYLAVFGSVASRIFAGGEPILYHVSGVLWIVAFGGFVLAYGPLLLRRKPAA